MVGESGELSKALQGQETQGPACCGTIKSGHVEPPEPGAPSVPSVDISDSMLHPLCCFPWAAPPHHPMAVGAAGAPQGRGLGGLLLCVHSSERVRFHSVPFFFP